MHIESIKLFCDVVQLSSFSIAAKNNKVTQSTVSQAVRQIETYLGILLIDRSQRPWKLTNEGLIYYEGCRKLIDDFYNLENIVKEEHDEASSIVKVAALYSVGLKHMKYVINMFNERFPKTKVQLKYLHSQEVYECVLKDEVDFGIVSFPKSQRELLISPWKVEQMILICPPDHKLSRQKIIAPQQISGENLIGFNKNLEIRKQIDHFLKRHNIDIEESLEFDNIESIKRAVEISTGISILPEPTIAQEKKNGSLTGIPFTNNDFVRPLGFTQRQNKKLNSSVLNFMEFLRET